MGDLATAAATTAATIAAAAAAAKPEFGLAADVEMEEPFLAKLKEIEESANLIINRSNNQCGKLDGLKQAICQLESVDTLPATCQNGKNPYCSPAYLKAAKEKQLKFQNEILEKKCTLRWKYIFLNELRKAVADGTKHINNEFDRCNKQTTNVGVGNVGKNGCTDGRCPFKKSNKTITKRKGKK